MKIEPQRYVAHLDILGFRALTSRDHHEAWRTLSALESALGESTNITIISDKVDGPIHVPELIRSIVFSDTIVLYSVADSPKDFHAIFTAVITLFSKALRDCVPIRIGISKGVFYTDEHRSMYAGPALIEAYDIGEESQWLGIVLSPSVAEDAVKQDLRSGGTKMVVEWDLPTKKGIDRASVANWPVALKDDFKVKPPLTTQILYSVFEPYYGPFERLDASVSTKYANTVKFVNEQYALHEKNGKLA